MAARDRSRSAVVRASPRPAAATVKAFDEKDPDQGGSILRKTASMVENGSPMHMSRRSKFVWCVKSKFARPDGSKLYSYNPEDAWQDPRDTHRAVTNTIVCQVCGAPLRKIFYRMRCYERRRLGEKGARLLHPEIFIAGQYCMRALLGRARPRTQRQHHQEDDDEDDDDDDDDDDDLGYEATPEAEKTAPRISDDGQRVPVTPDALKEPESGGVPVTPPPLLNEVRHCETESSSSDGEDADEQKPMRLRSGTGIGMFEEDESAVRIARPTNRDIPELKPSIFGDGYVSMLPLVAHDAEDDGAGVFSKPPHLLYRTLWPGVDRPPYVVVIPSYGRPQRLCQETLSLLRRQQIPEQLIEVWVAPGYAPEQQELEESRYKYALKGWPFVKVKLGVLGTQEQRDYISKHHPEGTHIVSFDDDVPELFCKMREGTTQDTLQPLPPGALECVIHHARDLMHEQGAYIWGFSPSANPMNMRRMHISRRNGMVNGFAYGYLNRHSNEFRSVYGSPTEDVERSCRFFNADGIVLRYSMYSARTEFKAAGGINLLYNTAPERKAHEEDAIRCISDCFPQLLEVRTGNRRRKTAQAQNFMFKSFGHSPIQSNGQPVPMAFMFCEPRAKQTEQDQQVSVTTQEAAVAAEPKRQVQQSASGNAAILVEDEPSENSDDDNVQIVSVSAPRTLHPWVDSLAGDESSLSPEQMRVSAFGGYAPVWSSFY